MSKILFINPPSPDKYIYIRDLNRSGRRSKEKIIWPQTSLAYLAAMVSDVHGIALVDCIAERMGWADFKNYLEEQKPDYIVTNVISSIVTNDLYATYLAKVIGAKTIAIGPHVTALPKESLMKYPSLDFCIIGEAELTLKELIETCEKKADLSVVKGIAWRRNGEAVINEPRPFIENLDIIPIARQDLLPVEKHRLPIVGDRYTFVLASRGCPFFCTFCRQPIMWKRKVRLRSPEKIMEELRYIKTLGIRNFLFHCDDFTINKDWVKKLCQMMIAENLDLVWSTNSRVDTVDEEMLRLMKRAGCFLISYGVESGSQKILDNVKKGTTVRQAEETLKISHKVGILNWGMFVMGLPGENEQTIDETIAFAKKMPFDYVNFAVGTPYPGTDFFEEAIKNNWMKNDKRWEGYDQNYQIIVEYPGMSAEKISKGIKKAYFAWYARPTVIIRMLGNANNWKHLITLVKVGFLHLFWKAE